MNGSRQSKDVVSYFESVEMGESSAPALRAERDALLTRVRILEASLACIGRECDLPDTRPELSFVAVQRIGSVVRQALAPPSRAPASSVRPIARVR